MKPEYDLECLIWDVQESMPIKVIHKWVKGHQNELKDGRTIFGPFTRDTQLNIEMDKLAVAGTNLPPVYRRMNSHTMIGIFDKQGKLVTDIQQYLYAEINGVKMKHYLQEKYDWETEHYESIEWGAIGEAIKSYSDFHSKKKIQMMYDWQNVGSQKEKIMGGDNKCPACELSEHHLHFVLCTHKKMEQEQLKQVQIF